MVTGDQTQAEEFNIAIDLLNKYKKDKDFIKKDVNKTKKKIDEMFEDLGVEDDHVDLKDRRKDVKAKTAKTYDPSVTIYERHKQV